MLVLTPAHGAKAEPPAPVAAMEAFGLVESWVRQWDVPVDPGEAIETSEPFAGASVTLRLDGEVIGRGSDTEGDRRSVWRAAFDALTEANRRLPLENDVLRAERARAIAKRVTISLELAGPFVPRSFVSYLDVELRVAPGLEGVALRTGGAEGPLLTSFPGRALASGSLPHRELASLVAQRAGSPEAGLTPLSDSLNALDAQVYTFRTTHLAQPGPGLAPSFLYRGAALVPQQLMTARELRDMADRLADHLMARRWPGAEPYGLLGTYDLASDRYDPPIASPVEQAVAGIALMRYAKMPGLDPKRVSQASDAALAILLDLARVAEGEADPAKSLVTAGACIVLIQEFPASMLPADRDLEQLRGACLLAMTRSFDRQSGFDPDIPAASRGLLALASAGFAEIVVQRDSSSDAERERAMSTADAVIRRVFLDTDRARLVGQMPWLGLAEVRLARVMRRDQLPAAGALRDMRQLVLDHQMTALDVDADSLDLQGGVVFSASSSPLPSWQSARPVSFLGTMIGQETLTDAADAPLELARLLESLRFLRQLQCDQGTAWMSRAPARAEGGIRAAPWSTSLPPDATSFTLIGVAETVGAMDRLTARNR